MRVRHAPAVSNCNQFDKPDSVGVFGLKATRNLEGEPRLPASSAAYQGDQTCLIKQPSKLDKFPDSPHEAAELNRQVATPLIRAGPHLGPPTPSLSHYLPDQLKRKHEISERQMTLAAGSKSRPGDNGGQIGLV